MPERNTPPKRSEIFWILIIAIAIIVVGFFLNPTNSHYNPENKQNAHKTYSDTDVVLSIPDNSKPLIPSTQPYTEKEKEDYVASRSDLAAQWAMAEYTFVGLIIGVVGIILIVLTFYQSRQAAFFAEQALDETKVNSRRELRAYLGTHIIAKNLNDTEQVPTIHIRFHNRGMSPAMGISCHVTGMGADETIERRASIQPNDIEEIEWPLEDLVMEEGVEEVFTIRIEYSDIFNGRRWLQADFFVLPQFDFPETQGVGTITNYAQGRDRADSNYTTTPYINPNHITERKIQFRYYTDDLQEEAREYAEANNPT